jgi:uncharacterized phiE125 gp8 family phage protein
MEMGAIKIITGPASEPVSLAEAKTQCRVDVTDDDALLTGLIVVAREEVERRTWHAVISQTLELVLDGWPSGSYIELPRPPLVSVSSVKYRTSAGVETTWSSVNYIAGADHIPGRLVLADGASWPSGDLYPTEAIRIRYVAGYTNAAVVPQSLKLAMLLLIAHWYENREAVVTSGAVPKDVPFGVEALCMSYRERAKSR